MYVQTGMRNRRLTLHGLNVMIQCVVSQYHAGLHLCVWWLGGGGGRVNLAEPDPYTGGEGLVTCYTQSYAAEMQCMAHSYMLACHFFNGHAMTTHDYCRCVMQKS